MVTDNGQKGGLLGYSPANKESVVPGETGGVDRGYSTPCSVAQ